MTEQQQQEVTNQFVQSLADAGVPIEMLTPEEMQQFLAEHGADPDMQFMRGSGSQLTFAKGVSQPSERGDLMLLSRAIMTQANTFEKLTEQL